MQKNIMKMTKILNKTKEKIKKISIMNILVLFPVIDFLTSMFAWNGVNIYIGQIVKGMLIIIGVITLLKSKKTFEFSLLFIGYVITEFVYVLYNKLAIINYITMILKIYFFPIMLMYFNSKNNENITKKFLVKIFYMYLFLLIVPSFFGLGHNISEIYENKSAYLSYFYSGNELSGTLLCLLPLALESLKNHHNRLTKILGLSLIIYGIYLLRTKTLVLGLILSVIYLLWANKKDKINKKVIIPLVLIGSILITTVLYNNFNVALDFYEIDEIKEVIDIKFVDKVLLSSRITFLNDVNEEYKNISLNEKLFGMNKLVLNEIKNVEMDIFDVFYEVGIVGFIVYLFLVVLGIKKTRLKGIYKFSFILLIIISFLSGHILVSPMVSIWLCCLVNASNNSKKEKRKVLMVSNMYPSKRFKHYGSFVKNMAEITKKLDYDVDISVMTKKNNILTKLIGYAMFYIKTFIKSNLNSYDYIYVHFISHSTAPILFAYKNSKNTKLILNAHGNDVVNDYNFEEKNVNKSRKYLKYADKVVVSSTYFKNEVNKIYNYPLENIVVYPAGGVNKKRFYEIDKEVAKEKLNLNQNYKYIGMVSRIEKNKGYDTLLEAIYMLKDYGYLDDYKLIIIGSGIEDNKMQNLINKYSLQDMIIKKDFVYQEELNIYYNAFDVLVFPTKRKSESLGLVGLEAMCTKTFVIGCNKYGPSEYLIDKVNSLTYNKINTGKELASKIIEYLNMDEKTKEKILENALDTVESFSEENIANKMNEIFGE